MSSRTQWFIVGMIILALSAMYIPRWAGMFTILLIAVLAITAAKKNLV